MRMKLLYTNSKTSQRDIIKILNFYTGKILGTKKETDSREHIILIIHEI